MKQYFLAAAILIGGCVATAQDNHKSKDKKTDPPAAVQSSFAKDHPAAIKATWDKEGQGFEVNFIEDKKEMSAVYSKSGELQETEVVIAKADLPANVISYVKQHYKSDIKEAAKITKRNGEINYEAEVNNTDLIFDKGGKYIKQQTD